jgi:hypothetical protein
VCHGFETDYVVMMNNGVCGARLMDKVLCGT